MRALVTIAVLATLAAADRSHDRLRYTDEALAAVRHTGDCGRRTARWWCRASDWEHGTAELLPFGKPLLGRWLAVRRGAVDPRDELVACVVTGTPGRAKIRLEPVGGRDALPGVTRVLEGAAPRATIGAELASDVKKLAGEDDAVAVDGEWFFDQKSDDVRLRKVGAFWIAILSPPPAAASSYPDARLVYVLTDAWD
jgi:hypothetical protein